MYTWSIDIGPAKFSKFNFHPPTDSNIMCIMFTIVVFLWALTLTRSPFHFLRWFFFGFGWYFLLGLRSVLPNRITRTEMDPFENVQNIWNEFHLCYYLTLVASVCVRAGVHESMCVCLCMDNFKRQPVSLIKLSSETMIFMYSIHAIECKTQWN